MGDHPLPGDEREIAAAVSACALMFDGSAYLSHRYGERGRQFCRSGGGFLIVTCRHVHAGFLEQVRWLVGLRAARGMPGWLLERHLVILHGCLRREIPAAGTRYDGLLTAATDLADRRRRHLAEDAFLAAASRFSARAPDCHPTLPEAGTLLAAALCDEAAGNEGAVRSLLDWLADPRRFPPEWIGAVHATAGELAAEISHECP
ncbi:MAG: hypothetical protein JNK22_16725 [Rhodocyclaceae bacterium]|nr:hypothetical protein [Rhodocyclaceae bacterium]